MGRGVLAAICCRNLGQQARYSQGSCFPGILDKKVTSPDVEN